MTGETIFALSTAPGKGGIAIVRVSGPDTKEIAQTLTGLPVLEPRYATLRRIAHRDLIDKGIVVLFPAPASFTGEDVVEFHVHGGRAIVAALSTALVALGCRGAEPGEFTKRAFLNGRVDLSEAEAIADLIAAETEAQHALALAQADGALSRLYKDWTDRLTHTLAYLEASLDFADEELPEILPATSRQVADLAKEVTAHLDTARQGERLRDGFRIAIIGAPNAGKSSLLNELAERDIAIVSERAGTTRDVVEAHLNLGGYSVKIADTAGIRETDDDIEAEGISRARRYAQQADLKLVLIDPASPPCPVIEALIDERCIVVHTKADLLPSQNDVTLHNSRAAVSISIQDHTNIDILLSMIVTRIKDLVGTTTVAMPTRERHRLLLRDVAEALGRFPVVHSVDMAAEELRSALQGLGRITGRVDAETILDVIFRDFCIGK